MHKKIEDKLTVDIKEGNLLTDDYWCCKTAVQKNWTDIEKNIDKHKYDFPKEKTEELTKRVNKQLEKVDTDAKI